MQTAPVYSLARLVLIWPDNIFRVTSFLFGGMAIVLLLGVAIFGGIPDDHPYLDIATEGYGLEVLIAIMLNFTFLFAITAHALLIKQRVPLLNDTEQSKLESLHPLFGVLGLIIACTAPLLEQYENNWNPYDVSLWWWSVGWHRVLTVMIGWEGGLMIGSMLINANRLNKQAQSTDFDLFDRTKITQTARQGLFNALVVILLPATLLPFFVDERYWLLMAALFALTVSFSFIGLLLPSFGLRKQILNAKSVQLGKITTALAALNETQNQSGEQFDTGTLSEINTLLDYQAHIKSIPDWPFDRSVIARYIAFLIIPLFTWTGGALAEIVIGNLID